MISIIIVNYRTPDDLCRLLDSLAAHPPSGPWEAVVVDNDSRDDSVERIREGYPHVKVIANPVNSGFAGGVNRGLAEASGEWLLLLNPDIEVKEGSLDALKAFMEANPRAGLAASRLLNPDGTLQYTCRRYYTLGTILLRRTFLGRLFPNSRAIRDHLMLDYDHAAPREVDWVAGACMMVRRAALEEVGPMDERYFMYFEDVDWCTRMHRRGWGVWYVPQSEMVHGFRRASARGFSKAARFHAGSFLRFWEKWSAALYLFRRHRRGIRALMLLLADVVALNLAFVALYYMRQGMANLFEKPLFPIASYVSFLVTTNVVAVLSFAVTGLYREERPGDWVDTMFRVGKALGAACLILLASTVLYRPAPSYSRLIILAFWPLALAVMTIQRRLVYALIETARERRFNVKRIALVGDDDWTEGLVRSLRQDPRHGFEPVRISLPPADRPEALRAALEDERVSDVILSTAALSAWTGQPRRLAQTLHAAGIAVHLSGAWAEALAREATVTGIAGRKLIVAKGEREGAGSLEQRAVAAGLVLVYVLPAGVLWVLLALGGRRPRKEPGTHLWTADGRAGDLLRRLSFDRFPGLFAVVRGALPLVGSGGVPGLFDGGRSAYDWAAAEDCGAAERLLRTVVRDAAGRLRGGSGPELGLDARLLKRSH